jgi:hypothetical protein
MRIKTSALLAAAAIVLTPVAPAHAVDKWPMAAPSKACPSYFCIKTSSPLTSWVRDIKVSPRGTVVRYGVQGRTQTVKLGTTTMNLTPIQVTTVSTFNGRPYAVKTFKLDKSNRVQWATNFPRTGKWTMTYYQKVYAVICLPSDYWWMGSECTPGGSVERVGAETFVIK